MPEQGDSSCRPAPATGPQRCQVTALSYQLALPHPAPPPLPLDAVTCMCMCMCMVHVSHYHDSYSTLFRPPQIAVIVPNSLLTSLKETGSPYSRHAWPHPPVLVKGCGPSHSSKQCASLTQFPHQVYPLVGVTESWRRCVQCLVLSALPLASPSLSTAKGEVLLYLIKALKISTVSTY